MHWTQRKWLALYLEKVRLPCVCHPKNGSTHHVNDCACQLIADSCYLMLLSLQCFACIIAASFSQNFIYLCLFGCSVTIKWSIQICLTAFYQATLLSTPCFESPLLIYTQKMDPIVLTCQNNAQMDSCVERKDSAEIVI